MYQTPYYQPYYQQTNNQLSLTRVNGIYGAKAYQIPTNSTVAMFDNNEDLMYIKTTDEAGFSNVRTFKFEEIITPTNTGDYITREEFEKLKEELINGKQFIQKPNNNSKQQHSEIQQRADSNG